MCHAFLYTGIGSTGGSPYQLVASVSSNPNETNNNNNNHIPVYPWTALVPFLGESIRPTGYIAYERQL